MDDAALTQLFRLARLEPLPGERDILRLELGSILQFVTGVQAAATLTTSTTTDIRKNILRADSVTHAPGTYTAAIQAQFPDAVGEYLAVHQVITGGKHAEGGH
jgi:Asp-tRNA(Asn)/Glu-tRNA(Gln) amidotransferase C subunit